MLVCRVQEPLNVEVNQFMRGRLSVHQYRLPHLTHGLKQFVEVRTLNHPRVVRNNYEMLKMLGDLRRKVPKALPKELRLATTLIVIHKGVGATTVVSHMFANIAKGSIQLFDVRFTACVVKSALMDGQGVLKRKIKTSNELNELYHIIRIASNKNRKYQDKKRLITMITTLGQEIL
jgi:hypothetical protein